MNRALPLMGLAIAAAIGLRFWSEDAYQCPVDGRVLSEEDLFLAALEVPAGQLSVMNSVLTETEAVEGLALPASVTPAEILLLEPECCSLTQAVAPAVREGAERFRASHDLPDLRGFVVIELDDPRLMGELFRRSSDVVGLDVCGNILRPM